MSQVYQYLKCTFFSYIADNLDPAGGYEFIRNAVLNLHNIGFTYFRSVVNFTSLEIYLPPDQFTQLILNNAYELYNTGELEKALTVANNCLDRCKNEADPILRIDALHLIGRINHDIEEYQQADRLYNKVLQLSEQYDYPAAFVSAVQGKSRLAESAYDLLEAEAGFRFALDYYAAIEHMSNMTVAINGLRRVAEMLMLFSRGPNEAIEFIKSLHSDYLSHENDTGYEFLEIRSLALYGIATIPQHRDYLANLVQKAFKLKAHLSQLSDLSLYEAEYISQFTDDNHIAVIRDHLKNQKRVELRKEPFKPKISIIEHNDSNPFCAPERAAENIDVLYSFLKNKDQHGNYVYRGQTKEYPKPLLPSAFRDILDSKYGIEYKDTSFTKYKEFNLRGCGSYFVGEYNKCFKSYSNPIKHLEIAGRPKNELELAYKIYDNILNDTDILVAQQNSQSYVQWRDAIQRVLSNDDFEIFLSNQDQWMVLINNYHKRLYRTGSFFQLFGYALGTTFAQQYGLSSEVLDATKSIDVACFFATHNSQDFQTLQSDGIGIIYRFPYEPSDIVSSHLSEYNYYNMPSIVDLQDIMYRFEKPGLNKEDSIKCFEYYFGAVFTKAFNDLDLLFLPEGFFETTRVSKQKAVIIFPDEIREDLPDREPGIDGIVYPKYRYIENLSTRKDVEEFYFRHNGTIPAEAKYLRREYLWPRDDDLLQFVVSIMMAQYPLISSAKPQRLDLIDGGYEQVQFNDYCVDLSQRYRISLFDGYSKLSSSFGTIIG